MSVSLTNLILDNPGREYIRRQKPDWLRAKLPGGAGYQKLRGIVDEHRLHTVCESARCPNMGECWARGTATIMILGDVCTRSCGFCHIATGRPPELDLDEPRRVGEAAGLMRLRHLVVTSVNRDELSDGGAAVWAETIRQIRANSPGTSVEVLIPDFCGDWSALQLVLDERPEILNHNMETVRRLYSVVRPQAKYDRSIELLRRAKEQGLTTKTGIMVGIGETDDEVERVMRDVVEGSGCDILTIGQYLQPTRDHLPITRWVTPAQFAEYKRLGESIGFRHVESGPLVRSSYHAEDQVLHLEDAPRR
jgi:lipoyl synthase